eukprot:gnl/Spiro4/22287_TR10974_c0_g1_i1.p2 gnl/Spiro4/22287_TR10974_c0_g1~~gnl/Spiro4/22287_TR10974_c0_g1_i1.p2  ORF type:complete len:254 (+),score=3.71 gnl/Spiro4/22287_TR10974_c0_g1_i1:1175-1936(+)
MARMIRHVSALLLSTVAFAAMIAELRAAELIGEYQAFISEADLYNSSGARLTEPWAVIRQDRANYHKFGKRDEGDGYDAFFASESNRSSAERMLQQGFIDPLAAQQLLKGNVGIRVRIYGHLGLGEFIQVDTLQAGPAPAGSGSDAPSAESTRLVSLEFLKSKLAQHPIILEQVRSEASGLEQQLRCYEFHYYFSQSPTDNGGSLNDAENLEIGINCAFHTPDGAEGESSVTLMFQRKPDTNQFLLTKRELAG